MTAILAKDKSNFELRNVSDGTILAIFTAQTDSSLAQKTLADITKFNSKLEGVKVQTFLVSPEETDSDQEFVIVDPEGELWKHGDLESSSEPGENLILLKKEGTGLKLLEIKEQPEDDLDWVESLVNYGQNHQESEPEEDYYKWGQIVKEDGEYLCKDCGYILDLKKGDAFPICEVCISGQPDGPSDSSEGYWELV